jgi:transposase-like protein
LPWSQAEDEALGNSFEPAIVKKRQNDISDFDKKIISMYAKGMTVRYIQENIKDTYGVEL